MADAAVLGGPLGLSASVASLFIPLAAVVGILFALYQYIVVKKVTVGLAPTAEGGYRPVEDGVGDDAIMQSVADIQSAISEGLAPTKGLTARVHAKAGHGWGIHRARRWLSKRQLLCVAATVSLRLKP